MLGLSIDFFGAEAGNGHDVEGGSSRRSAGDEFLSQRSRVGAGCSILGMTLLLLKDAEEWVLGCECGGE
jgi:hypothetical protein